MSIRQGVITGNWLNLRRIRAYPRLVLLVAALLGAAWIGGLHDRLMPNDAPNVTDFVNVYAAGQVARDGSAAEAYDIGKHKARQDAIKQTLSRTPYTAGEDVVPWLYPPVFLFVAWAFAFLPYWMALFLYAGGGFAAYVFAVSRLAPRYKESMWALAAFPAAYINMFTGQNGTLTAALLASGLAMVEAMPVVAGVCFGALIYKPQFFVLVPLALVAGRHWKAFFATAASAVLFAGASAWVFGIQSWTAFVRGLAWTTASINADGDQWVHMLQSVFAMARTLGMNVTGAHVLQNAVALCAAVGVLIVWRGRGSAAVKGAALATALLIVSPYSLIYDQVLLAIPLALMAREGLRSGFMPFEKTFLFGVWVWPLASQSVMKSVITLTPLVVIALFALIWRRAMAEPRNLKTTYGFSA